MVKKINLHAVGNHDGYNFYIFDKSQADIVKLSKAFSDNLGLLLNLNQEYQTSSGRRVKKKINFNKIKDTHMSITKVGISSRIDIFFGNKRMFVAVHCSHAQRDKFNKFLEKEAKIVKSRRKNAKRLFISG